MANRKMTLSKTKLSQSISMGLSNKVKSLSLAAMLLLNSSNASALSLGALEVASNLDQPLRGTIELRIADGDDLSSLTAVIASREDFESVGIEYPEYLEDVSILLDTLSGGGQRFLRVTSNNVIIKEPFIHFLVRVEWSGGNFLREYTALIDPPVYAADTPTSIAEPKEVGTDQSYQSETVDTPELDSETYNDVVAQDIPEPVDVDETLVDDGFYNDGDVTSEASSLDYSSGSQGNDASYGPVRTGESLSVIAQELQREFPDLSIYQIMKVLFEENRSAFIGENINGLIKGTILKIGDLGAIRSVDVAESRTFYSQQILEWDPQLLQASGDDSLNVGQDNYNFQDDDTSFEANSDDVDSFDTQDSFQVGASSESNDFVSSDQGGSREGEVLALRQEVATLQSSLASSELEKQELNERISLLEGQLADLNRLAELSVESTDLAVIEQTLLEQNAESDLVDDGSSSAIDEFSDTTDDASSAIDDFLTPGDEALSDIADEADNAIDDLVSDDSDSSLEEFTTESGDLISSGSDAVTDLEGVIDDTQSDTSVVAPAPETETIPIIVPAEKSFIEKAKSALFEGGLWKVLAGLGALLVAGLGLIFMRRRKADEEFEISMLSIESNSHSVGHSESTAVSASVSHTASIAPEATIADKETSFLTVYSDSDAVVQADEVDPVAEADVYIAYGRDEQAEEVLLDGVVSHPGRIDIKQKLLSLYHKRQNVEGFERIAEELYSQRAELTGDVWTQVCEMGKEVAPSNPLFELSGDDLNTVVEANSELNLGDGDIPEASGDEALDVDDVVNIGSADSSLDDAALDIELTDGDEVVDHLDDSLIEKQSDLGEPIAIEDESEMVVGSLADDQSIQLVDFDDGRSEISELDEVEIDALEFGIDALDASPKANDNVDGELEQAVSEIQEVSDLEIDPDYDEARTQYELAKVFVDLGDEDGARKILVELVGNEENSAEVLADSKALLDSIS